LERYVRHDLRIWTSTAGRQPRPRNDDDSWLFGDAVMDDWQARTRRSSARVRGYYDVIPDRNSLLSLDPNRRNRWGDPMPKIEYQDAPESVELRAHTHETMFGLFERMARAGDGSVMSTQVSTRMEHPGGGCRMGDDPATSVADSYGRTHDHENLFVIGGIDDGVGRVCEWDADVLCAVFEVRGGDWGGVLTWDEPGRGSRRALACADPPGLRRRAEVDVFEGT
jgi:hypothetical protein